MQTTPLVVAHFSCMHIMLFDGKNTHLEGMFDHVASQSMYTWTLHHILLLSSSK